MTVRPATAEDIPACVAMVGAHRELLQSYEPRFWRKSAVAEPMTQAFFGHLAGDPKVTFLVCDKGGTIEGFLIAMPQAAPPVFDPGGPTALIDDFCVASPELWPTVGQALLDETRARLRATGFMQLVMVSPYRHEEKKALAQANGLSLASNWWTTAV
jgi:hypothetical protein